MHCVYIVRCSDGSLYTGWSTDVLKRLQVHNSGRGAKYTRSRLPVTLVYAEVCKDKSAALSRERAIKALTRQQKEHLIQSCGAANGAMQAISPPSQKEGVSLT
ncbi:MAG: GIY-YIG nuclease family protein [Clostridia bacterium]